MGERVSPSPYFPSAHSVYMWEGRTGPGLNLPSVAERKDEWVGSKGELFRKRAFTDCASGKGRSKD